MAGPLSRSLLPAQRTFKAITYNILAPRYAGWNRYCSPEFLDWGYRQQLVLRELEHHAADLVALQECDQAFYEAELTEWMRQQGMEGEFLVRQVGPVPGPLEGIALLWRTGTFELVAKRALVYAEQGPQQLGLAPEVAGTPQWLKLQELGEGAVLAVLRHRPTGQLLLGACTHLFWNPAFPDVKALQAALLCSAMASFAAQHTPQGQGPQHVPVVLGGDFNSLASKRLADKFDPQISAAHPMESGVYTLLSTGSLPPTHPDHPAVRVWDPTSFAADQPTVPPTGRAAPAAAGFPAVPLTSAGLALASLNAEVFGREPPVTNRTATWAGCLDYVWLSRGLLAAADALAMPYDDGGAPPMGPAGGPGRPVGRSQGHGGTSGQEQQGQQQSAQGGAAAGGATWVDPFADITFTPIPDQHYPSDHLAVGGQLVLLPAGAGAGAGAAQQGAAGPSGRGGGGLLGWMRR